MVSTSRITDNGKIKAKVTIPELRVSNPMRTTVKREKSREPDARGWYLNSRAIRHVCNSRDMFVEFRRPMFHEKKVMQDTDAVDVEGIGKVLISFKSGEVMILSNVLYVPTMKINLISIDKLDYNRYTFHYEGKEVVIKRYRERVGKGYDTCGLYRLSINNDWPDAIEKLD